MSARSSACDALKEDNPDPAQRREANILLVNGATTVYGSSLSYLGGLGGRCAQPPGILLFWAFRQAGQAPADLRGPITGLSVAVIAPAPQE